MIKARFGTKEVIAVVASTIIYLLLEYIQNVIAVNSTFLYDALGYIQIMVLTIFMASFGPIMAVVSSVGVIILEGIMFADGVNIIQIVIWLIYGYLVGRFADKFGVLEGKFKGIILLDYLMVCVFVNATVFMLIAPLLRFIVIHLDIITEIKVMGTFALWNVLYTGVLGTFVLAVISMVIAKRHK